ncbi:DNA-binding SARP family transcriptional activator/tetratricopeptide (TPR) repeat protein [Streptomyces umbrinus]|uniref:AfsR/SARP family transcriptional regulator n=1 Tax=Streptomyces umbrinus TaxID=67370 RepID=UPI00167C75D5|nr:BTAD domain-containing putative transcriptional regulator [Streptomyces umbrinus]MCR3730958.1 DNA-binding SARP family transcriptional activator/tetratricopeptide (TPR) repeat protein [Streptomyces umbrinus]
MGRGGQVGGGQRSERGAGLRRDRSPGRPGGPSPGAIPASSPEPGSVEPSGLPSALRFGLLGPTVVYDADGVPRPVSSAKGRVLLTALLLEPGRVVSVDVLKDALWGGTPPASAHASLQNHVTRLRRLLDDPDRLRSAPPGYQLRVAEGELDVRLFETRIGAARAAHARRDWEQAVTEAVAALGLWRGTPLTGMPPGLGGLSLVQRLEEARLFALECRYDAELELGRGVSDGDVRLSGLAPELAALVAEFPLREAFHRQLMMVLHRTGRRAEALAVHRDLRRTLIHELGVEPGLTVREAHLEILRDEGSGTGAESGPGLGLGPGSGSGADVSVGADGVSGPLPAESAPSRTDRRGADHLPSAEAAQASPADQAAPLAPAAPLTPATPDSPAAPKVPSLVPVPRPAQLPPAPLCFTGRAETIGNLRATLVSTGAGAAAGHPRVAVVSGMAGVGKSALGVQVAHGLRAEFPDGQLYVRLHGATPGVPPLTVGQALAALLRDLGVEPRGVPEHPDAASALLRSMLAPTRTLLVLDDAVNAAQVRPLLPAGPGCAVIVTSRSPLTALDGVTRFPLAPLSDEESAELLRAVSGRDGLDGTHPLVGLTGRLPLALRIVAARLAARQVLTPDALAGQLAASEGRLHHLEYDDLSVRRSLAVALDALRASDREADRDAALALRRIGALDLPTYGVPLLARLLGAGERRTEAALDRLVDVALLDETTYGRYTPHDLVRDFAREVARETAEEDPSPTSPDPTDIALHWYIASARRCVPALIPSGVDRDNRLGATASVASAAESERAGAAGGEAVPFASAAEAVAWGDREVANVVALVEGRAAESPLVPVLVRALFPYLQRRGRLRELAVLGRRALTVARRLGDDAAEAIALSDLAGLHFMQGQAGKALVLTDQALSRWRGLGVVPRIQRCLNNRGLLLESLGRYVECELALRESLELARELGDLDGEAVAYSNLGNLYEHSDPRAAIEWHERSLALGETMGDSRVRESGHCNIGFAHLTLGEPARALEHFDRALSVSDGVDWQSGSQTRLGLVRALRGLDRTERAARECALLLARAELRADRYTAGLARHQQGLLHRSAGRADEAYEQWELALDDLDGTDSTVTDELRELLLVRLN